MALVIVAIANSCYFSNANMPHILIVAPKEIIHKPRMSIKCLRHGAISKAIILN